MTTTAPTRPVRVVVIGAGFGGLGAAHALREQGITDITILERADSAGGVWRDNTYPNAACDVPSPLYSWSWALNPDWGRRFSGQPQILDYLRSTAEADGLLDLVVTDQQVTGATYDEDARTWTVQTAAGPTYDADVVVTAVGQLSNPVVPDLPGAGTFAGPAFHSARWRHDVDLAGRRVAVVGTGASAIQFVPGIVDEAGAITVFQRSAPYVVGKPDTEYTPRHHRLFRRFPAIMRGERRTWFRYTELLNASLEGGVWYASALLGVLRLNWRRTLFQKVRDRSLRRKLVPDYPIGCKRMLFSNDWYPALSRDHVDVVTGEITGVEPNGVRTADGRLHEADVLVWGTGFAATSFLDSIDVTGVGGTRLHDVWADGAHAHLGIGVPGFPNFFCIYGPNTNLGGSSIINMMEAQARYVAQVARRLADGRARALVVRPEVAASYDREMQDRLAGSVWTSCTSWYRDGGRVTTNWPGRVTEYQQRLASVDWAELEDVG